jgi:hypothetical protein
LLGFFVEGCNSGGRVGEFLADGFGAYRLGRATAALIFPLAGALLLMVGVYRRRAFNRWNRQDDDRLLRSDSSEAEVAPGCDEDFDDPGPEVQSQSSGRERCS